MVGWWPVHHSQSVAHENTLISIMQNIINKKKHPEVLASVLTDKEYRAWIN